MATLSDVNQETAQTRPHHWASRHRNPRPRAPVPSTAERQRTPRESTLPSPTPPARGPRSLGRVNIPGPAGFHGPRGLTLSATPHHNRRHETAPAGTAIPVRGPDRPGRESFPMGTQNPSVPPHAQARVAGDKHPDRRPGATHRTGGLQHDNSRHTTRFTVIGNHLAQHRELSLLAIGLATHLQSLPKGAPADIKTLAARFPEGTTRIAAALRELEGHGYLRRERVRTPTGRIVTRTISCNQPAAARHPTEATRGATESKPRDACEERASRVNREARAPRKPLPAVPTPAYPAVTIRCSAFPSTRSSTPVPAPVRSSPTSTPLRTAPGTPPARTSSTGRTSPSVSGPAPRAACRATRTTMRERSPTCPTRADGGRGAANGGPVPRRVAP